MCIRWLINEIMLWLQEPRNILFGQGQPLQREPSEPSQGAPTPSQTSLGATSQVEPSQASQGATSQPPYVAPSQAFQPSQRGRSNRGRSQRVGTQRGRGNAQSGWERGGTHRGSGNDNLGGWRSWFECSR